MSRFAIFLPFVALVAAPRSLCAQDSNTQAPSLQDTLKAYPINEVTVTESRVVKEVSPVQVLSGKELRKLSVYSVADAIRYFSGAQIKDYGGIGGLKTVNVRSLGSQHVGVFYDGMELGNAQNGVVDLGRFSLDNMEAVSIYNGQKSAIFQPAKDYASASALYLTARKPVFKGNKRNNVIVGLTAGSFDTVNPSLRWERELNEKLSVSVSSEYLYTSGRYEFSYARKNGYDTTEVRRNGDVRMSRMEGTLFGKVKDGEWRAKAYVYDSERGYPGASVREAPGQFKHQDRQWDTNIFVQGSLRKSFGTWYSLLVNGKYARDYLHYLSDPREDVTTMYVNNHYTQQEVYFSAAHLFAIAPWWSASLANDLQWNTLDADLVGFVYPNRHTLLSSAATFVEWRRLRLQASLLHTYVVDHTRTTKADASDKSLFTPSVVISSRPLESHDLSVRAFYKRTFRMPTFNDLYYTFIGNKFLNPEHTTQYDLGLTYTHEFGHGRMRRMELQVDGYFNQVRDKIIAMPTSNQFRWTMLNLGYVEIRGIDVAAQGDWHIGDVEMQTRLSYTYQRAQDFTDPTSKWYGGQIPYVPWHSGSVIFGGSYGAWSWNYSFIYTGERYEAVANIPENHAQPWYTHDLGLSRTFLLLGKELRVAVEVNNLFNQQYEVVQCYPMPGTNFKSKILLTL